MLLTGRHASSHLDGRLPVRGSHDGALSHCCPGEFMVYGWAIRQRCPGEFMVYGWAIRHCSPGEFMVGSFVNVVWVSLWFMVGLFVIVVRVSLWFMVGLYVIVVRVSCIIHGWAIRHCCPGELYYSWLGYSSLLSG